MRRPQHSLKVTFQFSLRDLLAAIAWLAASVSFFIYSEDDCTGLLVCIGLVLAGTGIGQLFGRPLRGFLSVIGIFVAIIVLSQMLAGFSG